MLVLLAHLNSTRITTEYPDATYVHCRPHVLSLELSSSCKNVPEIRNILDSLENLAWVFVWKEVERRKNYVCLEVAEAYDAYVEVLKQSDKSEDAIVEE